MSDIVRLGVILVLIMFLLGRGVNVGYVLMMASGSLAALYMMPLSNIETVVTNALTAGITLKLLLALTMIRIFEIILRENAVLEKMMDSIKALVRSKKLVIISMPLLIGMLPSVGGAYFSAPMVKEATKDLPMTREDKSFANYWYRHPWEFILPLYPGLVLASALTSIALRDYILLNFSYAAAMFVLGFWNLKEARGGFNAGKSISMKGIWSFLPITLLLVLVIMFHIELHYALGIIVFLLIIYFRYTDRRILKIIKHGLSKDVVILILGVMFFKEVLEVSGAVGNISRYFTEKSIPVLPVLFFLPFLTGLLTGITVGFVGSTFPLILNLTGADPYAFSFAFASGFAGVLLSPVHVCLILTKEYFKADMLGIYKKTIPMVGIILLLALGMFLLLD
jgi:integral membrane protein (TIGR00529 family)